MEGAWLASSVTGSACGKETAGPGRPSPGRCYFLSMMNDVT